MHTLILMPQLFHGGAETQFRKLFENLEYTYIAALDASQDSTADDFKNKYKERILELRNPHKTKLFYQIQIYINIIISIVYFKWKVNGKITLIIYGAGTRWLILYPIIRLFKYRILFSERNDGHHKLKLLYRIIEHCDIVTTNSVEAKEIMSQYIKKKPIHVINNGIVIPKKDFKQYKPHNPFKILVPARIHEIKNQKVIIEAFKNIQNIEIHFAGQVDDSTYYNQLKETIRKHNVEKMFIFDGYIENISSYYNDFDLVILSSISEGTPNVLLESMAYCIPCIASNISMNARLIHDKRFLFKPNDANSLFMCYSYFRLKSSREIETYILDNYDYVSKNYSVKQMVDGFNLLIKQKHM